MCHILNLDAFSWGETPKGVSFKKVRLTVMLAVQCHPSVTAVHISSRSIFLLARAWLPGFSGPQLPLTMCCFEIPLMY